MHCGKAYHDFMLASARDLKVRRRFQKLVKEFSTPRGTIFDFGAGTGIDARAYAQQGFRVLAYEPGNENRSYLAQYCREEIASGAVALSDLSDCRTVELIAANFAVLNLVQDRAALFASFDRILARKGYVVVNFLNPFFAGDARYAWWRAQLPSLIRHRSYVVEGENGAVYRFTPSDLAQAARPAFWVPLLRPRAIGLAVSRYLFMVLQKI